MESINITPIIDKISQVVEKHRLAPGCYKRFPEDTFPNPYGCADAANILYTIGRFPKDARERNEHVRILREMQNPETGMFTEKPSDVSKFVHDTIHTTAHCMAALELFDASPLYPAKELLKYLDGDKINVFLESFDWRGTLGVAAHRGAGIYVALNLGGSDCREFNKKYYKWLWENVDSETGLWRKGHLDGPISLWYHMGTAFHFIFNLEHAHIPLRYPERLIDTCISLYRDTPMKGFGESSKFIECDWVYCLTRASRQTKYRFDEVMECISNFAEKYVSFWQNADYSTNRNINDMHELFGGVSALAELQSALPGKLYSDKPLKLVLDRRPFI